MILPAVAASIQQELEQILLWHLEFSQNTPAIIDKVLEKSCAGHNPIRANKQPLPTVVLKQRVITVIKYIGLLDIFVMH